jgi:8-oxo-dGTP pyrophosphatase MutT (NUDIX family)
MSEQKRDALSPGDRLAAMMNDVKRDQSFPNTQPRDAATLILVDRSGPVPKVLLGKRHQGHKFMPGKFVFPGGRVEPADRLMPSARPLDRHAEDYLMRRVRRASANKARALAMSAIRETFEETGLLLGIGGTRPERAPDGPWSDFAAADVVPDLAEIRFVARAITPPRRPKRFDTRFFTIDANAIARRVDGVVGPDSELVELAWIPIKDARTLDMPAVTGVILEELEARIAQGFGHDLPVPFYKFIGNRFIRELL